MEDCNSVSHINKERKTKSRAARRFCSQCQIHSTSSCHLEGRIETSPLDTKKVPGWISDADHGVKWRGDVCSTFSILKQVSPSSLPVLTFHAPHLFCSLPSLLLLRLGWIGQNLLRIPTYSCGYIKKSVSTSFQSEDSKQPPLLST